MADETKRYPPGERKLARLWQAGSTPASQALVGAAVIVTAGLLAALEGPGVVAWMSEWVRGSLRAAAQPDAALEVTRVIALRGGLLIAAIGALAFAGAVAAQIAQRGRRSEAVPAAPGGDRGGLSRVDAWRGARGLLLAGLAAVVLTAAVRGVLMRIEVTFDPHRPLGTLGALAGSVGRQLLVVLIATAVLDAIAERAGWIRGAWMTRREVEDEMREAEGHPLTRERRAVVSRRRRDA